MQRSVHAAMRRCIAEPLRKLRATQTAAPDKSASSPASPLDYHQIAVVPPQFDTVAIKTSHRYRGSPRLSIKCSTMDISIYQLVFFGIFDVIIDILFRRCCSKRRTSEVEDIVRSLTSARTTYYVTLTDVQNCT